MIALVIFCGLAMVGSMVSHSLADIATTLRVISDELHAARMERR